MWVLLHPLVPWYLCLRLSSFLNKSWLCLPQLEPLLIKTSLAFKFKNIITSLKSYSSKTFLLWQNSFPFINWTSSRSPERSATFVANIMSDIPLRLTTIFAPPPLPEKGRLELLLEPYALADIKLGLSTHNQAPYSRITVQYIFFILTPISLE